MGKAVAWSFGHAKKVTGSDVLSLHTREHCPSVCICWPQSEAISHKHAQALVMSNSSVQCIPHSDLNIHPYKLQIFERSGQRGHQFQRILTEDPDLPNNLLMTEEAHCHLQGTVKKQNLTIMVSCKSLWTSPTPLYDPNITIWCAVSSRGVMWPYFLKDEDGQAITIISQCCTDMINEFLAPKLPQNHNLWFQQDGAMAHMSVIKHGCALLFVTTAGDISLQ